VTQQLYRRCGCRDDDGKQLDSHCPKLTADPKHGTWGYYLSHGTDTKTGQRRQFRKAGFKTKREAGSALAELKTKLDKGTYVKPTTRTLGEYAREWLPRRQRTDKGLKPTTVAGYKRYITDDIAPSALGQMKLTPIFAAITSRSSRTT
jgi:hypothetical protein